MSTALFLEPKDLMKIDKKLSSYTGAFKALQRLKDSLGKKEHHKVTIKEYANYYNVDEEEIKKHLNN